MILTLIEGGIRVDKFLSESLPDLSRSRIQKLLVDGHITLNGEKTRPSHKLKVGDVLEVTIPEPTLSTVEPEDIDLDVLYEDDQIIVINRPSGMVVHPAAGNWTGTLVGALLGRGSGLSGVGGVMRPGIVHRLDKETSGVIVVAKNDHAHTSLSDQLKDRTMSRNYLAVVKGRVKTESGEIDKNIGRSRHNRKKMAVMNEGGRSAITRYRVLQELEAATLVEVTLKTGRTHQIRVHMLSINHPVVGDEIYGRPGFGGIKRQALHAWKLRLRHPTSGDEMDFRTPIPSDMIELLEELGGDPKPYV